MKHWLSHWDIPHSSWSIQTRVIDENVLFLDESLTQGLQVSAFGEYFLFCAPGAFVMTKTYFMTGEPFGQLITQSNRWVQATLWLPGVCLGTVSACAWQVFCGLVTWGLVFKARNSWVSLCKFHPLPPGESAASCNPQLLPSCQIYLRNSGQHRPARNSSGSALVKLPDDNRKINWEV